MDYKDSLLLPKTSFPMRGNLTQNEKTRYKEWFDGDVYERMKAPREQTFTFHDGPPYANGNIHIGHALNKILKDIIVKFHFFNSQSIRFTPGWDCHGLPIEQQVEKNLGKAKKNAMSKPDVRVACAKHAQKFVGIQSEEFKSLGVIADWQKPYITMDKAFEANIYRQLISIASKGLLKQRKKPVFWSWAAKTALAEAEVEYHDKEDLAVFVAFGLDENAQEKIGQKASLVIWTTTPWTLSANVAISINPHEQYVLSSDGYIVAQALFESLKEKGVINGNITKTIASKDLELLEAVNPLNDRKSVVILGNHVSMESGTGCVHTAPGHGGDDYEVCLKYKLKMLMGVDDDGCYDETIIKEKMFKNPQEYLGKHVLDLNEKIIEDLGSACIFSEKITHSYPFCWRTNKPIIHRATTQWFILMDKPYEGKETLRQRALDELKNVEFYPKEGRRRLESMIEARPDWCISRQRDWGVPIAFFRDKKTKKAVLDPQVLNYIAMIFEQEGAVAWWNRDIKDLLYPGSALDPDSLEKITDILDVWFDSGSTQFAVLQSGNYDAGNYPASMYLEGSDQHRGWFQSSLLVSVASSLKAPYKSIVTHGFTMDQRGEKMSKSKGNVVLPSDIVKRYGSEILRLWVGTSDYQDDQRLSEEIIKQTSEQYKKIRNTLRFLLANITDLNEPLELKDLGVLDKWIMCEARDVFDEAHKYCENYDFSKALAKMNNFFITDLSGIYLDACKDRLYCSKENSLHRRGAQTACYYILQSSLGLLAPILTYTCDEVIAHAPDVLSSGAKDIFDFCYKRLPDLEMPFDTQKMRTIKDGFNLAIDELKKSNTIKNTLELTLYTSSKDLLGLDHTDVSDWFVVSHVQEPSDGEVLHSFEVDGEQFSIARSSMHKCPRCWKFNAHEEDMLCKRCEKAHV